MGLQWVGLRSGATVGGAQGGANVGGATVAANRTHQTSSPQHKTAAAAISHRMDRTCALRRCRSCDVHVPPSPSVSGDTLNRCMNLSSHSLVANSVHEPVLPAIIRTAGRDNGGRSTCNA